MEPVWRVLIFLAPLCPICQNMSFDLRQLEKDFAGEPVEFVGVFPNPRPLKTKSPPSNRPTALT